MTLVELNRWLLPWSAQSTHPARNAPASRVVLRTQSRRSNTQMCMGAILGKPCVWGGALVATHRERANLHTTELISGVRVTKVPMKTRVVPPSGLRDSGRVMVSWVHSACFQHTVAPTKLVWVTSILMRVNTERLPCDSVHGHAEKTVRSQ